MECIQDIFCGRYALVGIKDYINCPVPENVLFINDLPGMTLLLASAIANQDQRTGYNLLTEKIIHASKLIINRFSHIASANFEVNSILEAKEVSSFGNTTNDPIALERGLIIKKPQSETAKIFIEEVYIKTLEGGIVNVKIYDGDVTKTYQVSTLANTEMAATIKYKCKSNVVKIVFDQTNHTTFGCDFAGGGFSSCRSCGGGNSKKHDLKILGWDGSNDSYTCYGLGVLANVQCYEEEIICQLLPRMAFMILYQSGIEIAMEALASNRINPVITFGKEKAEQLANYCQAKLQEEEVHFSSSIRNFLKSTRGECFTCKGTRITYGIPG